MEHLASEYDPETGKFQFTIDDNMQVELEPEQYVEFVSQSLTLIDYVVAHYFDGSMKKFISKNKSTKLPINSKKFADDIDKYIRKKSSKMDFGA
jgi:hypothetical protein